MDKIIKNFAIGLVALIILAPLGLLAVGETFGEWGPEEVKEKLGFVPPGLEQLSSLWSAPLPDYALPGQWRFDDHSSGRLYPVRSDRRVLSAVACFTSWARRLPKTNAFSPIF